MTGSFNTSHMLFALFLFLGTVLIGNAEDAAHFLAGGIYLLCSLAFVVLS
jgi:hypothetical protein